VFHCFEVGPGSGVPVKLFYLDGGSLRNLVKLPTNTYERSQSGRRAEFREHTKMDDTYSYALIKTQMGKEHKRHVNLLNKRISYNIVRLTRH